MTPDEAPQVIARGARSSDLATFTRMYEAMLRVNGWTKHDARGLRCPRVRAADGWPLAHGY
jgi:hypothetical protein